MDYLGRRYREGEQVTLERVKLSDKVMPKIPSSWTRCDCRLIGCVREGGKNHPLVDRSHCPIHRKSGNRTTFPV